MKSSVKLVVAILIVFVFSSLLITCGILNSITDSFYNFFEDPNEANYEYKIGDRGPAGGIIFHRRIDENGRYYLEAAPNDLSRAQWGLLGIRANVTSGSSTIGIGKQNTENLVDALKNNGERGRAAQLCNEFTLNGFRDWFLPSYDEILHMYNNLRKQGLGGFRNDLYWSSSQGDLLMGTHNAFAKDFNIETSGQYLGIFGKDMLCSVRPIRMFTIN